MNTNKIINKCKSLELFKEKYKNDSDIFYTIEANDKLEKPEQIKKVLNDLSNESKNLRIGIVGRVKAGKSSLLNALIFDGEDVLPKAATPMTASLTIMKYSETMHAEVDFFNDEDIQELKNKYKEQQDLLAQKEKEAIEEEKKKAPERQNFEKAARKAKRDIKDSPYAASADQYERILASGITSVKSLEKYREIHADSMEELNQKLEDFVGANGKYMPFTKSVTLYLPEESLNGLEIVDTPGVNDPVQSRGKRTEELLSQCDVVFMISPAGQFLSEQDTDLMLNMTTAKGIRYVYLVASQCDTQLMSSEYQNLNIKETLDKIRSTLKESAVDTLEKALEKAPEMEEVFNQCTNNELFLTAGACYGLAKNIEQPDKWDETQAHIYKLLSNRFSTDFENKSKSKAVLNELANIENIKNMMPNILHNKASIILQKSSDYQTQQEKALNETVKLLHEKLKEKEEDLKNNTLESLEEKRAYFNNVKESIRQIISTEYKQRSSHLVSSLETNLRNTLKRQINKFVKGEEETGYTERTESYEVKVGERSISVWYKPWTWGDTKSIYETRYRTVRDSYTYVRATPIRNSILDILDDLSSRLTDQVKSNTDDWKSLLNTELRSKLKELNNRLDSKTVKNTLEKTLTRFPKTEFTLAPLPRNLDKTGQLNGSEGEQFMYEAQKYINQLENNVRSQINDYVENLSSRLSQIKLADHFIGIFQEDINELEESLRNIDSTLKKYQEMRDELNSIK